MDVPSTLLLNDGTDTEAHPDAVVSIARRFFMSTSPSPINLFDFEAIAQERLPKAEYDYIAGGATDEISVERNRRAYECWALRPRVLRDVSALDLSTTVLGTRVSLPVLIAPCGAHKRAHRRGTRHLPGRGGLWHDPRGQRQFNYFL